MSSYQYRDPHVKDKSCLLHRNPHTWKRQIRVIGMNVLRPNILATIHCINQCYCMNQQLDTLRTNITYNYKICRKDNLKKRTPTLVLYWVPEYPIFSLQLTFDYTEHQYRRTNLFLVVYSFDCSQLISFQNSVWGRVTQIRRWRYTWLNIAYIFIYSIKHSIMIVFRFYFPACPK